MKLYIGNKNYSSWSLRAWLMAAKSGVKFDEVLLPLDTDSFYQQLQSISPTLKVPTLVDGDITVWDSLSICEYINDCYLSGAAWPQEPKQKAKARSLACEMHSGFHALRNALPMNIRARRYVELNPAVQQDIARIDSIWSQQMTEFTPSKNQGTWLFGEWSIADMMFAPLVMRFFIYEIEVSQASRAYMEFIVSQPEMQAWITAAKVETEIVEADEAGVDR